MFNMPRGSGSLTASSYLTQSVGGFADPLATSSAGFGDVDPWSETQTPTGVASPTAHSINAIPDAPVNGEGKYPALGAWIADPPTAYISLVEQLDPSRSESITLSAIQRMLGTSELSGSTVEKIVHLAAHNKAKLQRNDVFRILALVALVQSQPDADVSLQAVNDALPLPNPRLTVPSPDPAEPTSTPALPPAPPQSLPSSFSPWDTAPRYAVPGSDANGGPGGLPFSGGNPDAEAERGYWRRLESVEVTLIPERESWFLRKYRVVSNRRADVLSRRYSDFVWLHHTLVARYPFRLLPALPPKRLNPDEAFLEQRRKGLQRFLNAVVNHPVMRDDGALNVFMTEPNFEAWRKRVKVSTEEESSSKRLTPAQEMAIPADLEEKLDGVRNRLPFLIASYQKMVHLAERELQHVQTSAAEATRFAISLQAVAEDMPAACHRCVPGGKCCDLCQGTGRGLAAVGHGWTRLAEQRERDTTSVSESIESLKSQRDLYIAFRDLFVRYERLSVDHVDLLRKKVEARQSKIEGLRAAQKPGFEAEVEKLINVIEQDNSTIGALLARRVFIRACMWHELAVVFHSRQAAQATLGWQAWIQATVSSLNSAARVWDRMNEDVENMPLE